MELDTGRNEEGEGHRQREPDATRLRGLAARLRWMLQCGNCRSQPHGFVVLSLLIAPDDDNTPFKVSTPYRMLVRRPNDTSGRIQMRLASFNERNRTDGRTDDRMHLCSLFL